MKQFRSVAPWMLERTGAGPMLTLADFGGTADFGAFVVEVDFAMSDWTPASDTIIARHGQTDGNLSWSAEIQTTGRPRANYYDLGTLATRIGTASLADPLPSLVDGQRASFRWSFLADFLGLASAYVYDVRRGCRSQVGAIASAGHVGTAFDSTEPITIGEAAGVERLYGFRIWSGIFGQGQLQYRRIRNDAEISQHVGESAWVDRFGGSWTLGSAAFARSDRQFGYVA